MIFVSNLFIIIIKKFKRKNHLKKRNRSFDSKNDEKSNNETHDLIKKSESQQINLQVFINKIIYINLFTF
jgi:hypothetical protein